MANDKKLTQLTELTTVADDDYIYVVDTSDTSGGTGGTSKKAQVSNAIRWPQTSAESSAGITPTNYQYEPGNVLRYGAVGDNSTDCATAFQAALDSNEYIFIPAGDYVIKSALTLEVNRCTVAGVGMESNIVFNPTSNDQTLFSDGVVGGGDNYRFYNFNITANAGTSTGRRGFTFTSTTTAVMWDLITMTTFDDYCIKHTSAQYDKITRCRFINCHNSSDNAIAISFPTFANAVVIRDSRFSSNDRDIIGTTSARAVVIEGCSFESTGSAASTFDTSIELEAAKGLAITGNYFEAVRTKASGGVIYLKGASNGVKIEGNMFAGDFGGTTYSHYFVWLDANVTHSSVSYNHMAEVLSGFIKAPSTGIIEAHGNYYEDGASEVTTWAAIMALMSGTARIDLDVPLTFTYDPGSLADGAGETHQETMLGASFGDFIQVAAPYDLQDITVTGYVQASNVIEVRVQNESGGVIDLGSGTWSVFRKAV